MSSGSRHLALRRLAAASLVAVALGATAIGQTCRSDQQPNVWARVGGKVASDGKLHYKVGIAPAAPQSIRDAVDRAIASWNAVLVGIVLERSDGSEFADLAFSRSYDPALTLGCAAFDTGSSSVIYDVQQFESWAGPSVPT